MQINVIIPSFYPAVVYGGPIFSSYNTCKELALSGNQVFVSTTNSNMYSRLTVETGKFIELEKRFFVKYYNETIVDKLSLPLLLNIRKDIISADVVHIQSIFNTPTPVALYFSSKENKPVLISPRGVLGSWIMNQGNSFKKQWLNLFIKPFADKIWWHATADQEKAEILSHFPNAKVVVIPNGIDTLEFSNPVLYSKEEFVKKYTGAKMKASHVIVSMGRLHKKKGFDILITSFKFLLKEFPESVLLIAGQDEGEKENLQNLILSEGIDERAFIIEPLNGSQKTNFLANADLFVLPSHNENFGNVYAEALACGTPIVASRNTPWKDVELAGCGRWVNNTKEENYMAIKELLNSDQKVLRANSKIFIERYSWKNVGAMFETVFSEIKNS
ncbi:a-glycosyltransferase [Sporocytophaga myxococcoides]|uniref:A-glycosyltransferase n=1 Tax=Sporocytophaga myxococcoides TaxID=153721 RepID=A0A098LC87_9BACT|nr:glycosyltransferase [Sporocytophaga myxococcoides]GAL84062.1 a-glycosyltransferase [Sporocytophaga myxococcoides]